MMSRIFFLSLIAVFGLSISVASAQDNVPGDADRARRIELAQAMNNIRPAKIQVQEAVNQIAQNLPPLDRDRFMRMVDKAFDYGKLEKLSVETMADLFTAAELQKMVDYFSSPEGEAISRKLPQYQAKLQPEIIKMLDKAMMEQRTGAAGDKAAPTAPSEP
jgi:hypothetical protein